MICFCNIDVTGLVARTNRHRKQHKLTGNMCLLSEVPADNRTGPDDVLLPFLGQDSDNEFVRAHPSATMFFGLVSGVPENFLLL